MTTRALTAGRALRRDDSDARIRELGREIAHDYATIRESYATPKHPIVLAHGLLGFSELSISSAFPPLQYWHGIKQALAAQGCSNVTTASVPPSGSIEERAAKLAADIAAAFPPSSPAPRTGEGTVPVNIIAHSMGGLDARYLISHLQPQGRQVTVASLTTIATPHRGSMFADYLFDKGAGPIYLPKLYRLLEKAGLGTKAFAQLTTRYMAQEFNPQTPDDPLVRYYSYGAVIDKPPLLSPFRLSYKVIDEAEGPNDGLVSVDSSRWGIYEGTLVGVSHLDLINWTNKVRWTVREWMGYKKTFNAIAFYLAITDMLAREGL
ncbi:lipase [Hirsutella rhossiliensis]|uniref:Lipase n=1 Tax=Hirsutella rhossiliensis TaxID=111463 RepID=A0A9P8N6M2_9HYPO|nr:lipase [Hirsutella rhossiliensis]KAH0967507.1 lipase [Hirsutella rhossiliensis]